MFWLFDGEHFLSKWIRFPACHERIGAVVRHTSSRAWVFWSPIHCESRRRRNFVDFFHACQADKTREAATLSAVLKQVVLICWLSSWVCSSAGGKESVKRLMQRCCRLERGTRLNPGLNLDFSFFCTYPQIGLHKVDSYINQIINSIHWQFQIPNRGCSTLNPGQALVDHRTDRRAKEIFLDLILSAVSPSSNHPMSLLVALDDVRFVVKFEIAYFWTSFLHEWNLHVLARRSFLLFYWTLSAGIALGFDHCGILRPSHFRPYGCAGKTFVWSLCR